MLQSRWPQVLVTAAVIKIWLHSNILAQSNRCEEIECADSYNCGSKRGHCIRKRFRNERLNLELEGDLQNCMPNPNDSKFHNIYPGRLPWKTNPAKINWGCSDIARQNKWAANTLASLCYLLYTYQYTEVFRILISYRTDMCVRSMAQKQN